MVKNGGPVAAASVLLSSDFSFPESPPDGLVFDAKIKGNMSFGCNLGVVFNLKLETLDALSLPTRRTFTVELAAVVLERPNRGSDWDERA